MNHMCEQRMYWEEYYMDYVPDGWPPQCRHCGKFMKWPKGIPMADEFAGLFEEASQSDAGVKHGP